MRQLCTYEYFECVGLTYLKRITRTFIYLLRPFPNLKWLWQRHTRGPEIKGKSRELLPSNFTPYWKYILVNKVKNFSVRKGRIMITRVIPESTCVRAPIPLESLFEYSYTAFCVLLSHYSSLMLWASYLRSVILWRNNRLANFFYLSVCVISLSD